MAIADHLKKSHGGVDKVSLVLQNVNEEDRRVLEEALLPDSGYTHADIGKALRAEGHGVTDSQVWHFRKKLKEKTSE